MATNTLAALREDLRLYDSGTDSSGAPIWAIQDPVTNRFYRIGWVEYECLLRWPNDPEKIAHSINTNTPLNISPEVVQNFAAFLTQHHLIRPTEEAKQQIIKQMNQPRWRHWRWWLQNYLFFRLPIVRPQRLLEFFLPFVRLLFNWWALAILLLLTVTGLILVAQQWDVFTHDVVQMFTPEGLFGFALALIISKFLHELGHAFVATHYGVRVAHMGVAFLVMWPMLYTDTGESWRLKSHKQRLAISIAGVSTELALAGVATLMWAVLPEGALRQSMLYLATTGWILSLALNVSPFMRFDGYFILSDVLDFPNLHERAGRTARTWLRRHLLGWQEPYAEEFSTRKRRFLVIFAWATWLYRFVIFLSIAIAIYVFFFKLLGIILMAVEIAWLILRPVWSEVKVWIEGRKQIAPKNRVLIGLFLLGLGLLLVVPLPLKVKGIAVARPERAQYVFTPFAAQLQTLHPAGQVQQGSLLASFIAPEYTARAARTEANIHALNQRLSGLLADQQGLAQDMRLRRELQEQLAESLAVLEESGQLNIRAEFDGIWLDVDPLIKSGVWLSTDDNVGVLVNPNNWIIDAYIAEHDLDRIDVGAQANFYPSYDTRPYAATLLAIDPVNTRQLPYLSLADRHGGEIATMEHEERLLPARAVYRARLQLLEPLPNLQETHGTVRIKGQPKSLLIDGAQSLYAILLRESNF